MKQAPLISLASLDSFPQGKPKGQGEAVKFPLPFWGGSWYNKENTP